MSPCCLLTVKKDYPMIVLSILFLLLAFSLKDVISDRSLSFYKDSRFWVALTGFLVLVMLAYQRHPLF